MLSSMNYTNTRHKKILVLVLLISSLFVISACSSKESKVEKTPNKYGLIKQGTLKICSDIPYAPFEFYEGSRVVGVDAELIVHIADQLKLRTEFIDTDFDQIFSDLKKGKCDIIASAISITEDRKEANNFSDPYYEISQSILVINSNAQTLTDLDKLDSKIVGVQSDTTGEAFAQEHSATNHYSVISYVGLDELIMALKKGEVDAVIQDYPINAYQSVKSGTTKVTKQFEGSEEYGFVVPKDKSLLLKDINKALEQARYSGDYDEIIAKYFGS